MYIFPNRSVMSSLGTATIEIGGALIVGALAGRLATISAHYLRQSTLRLPMVAGLILLVVGLAETWAFSPLLAAMAMGFTSRNLLRTGGDRLFAPVEYLEEMVFILFFTLAGIHFEFGVFFTHVDLILIYFLARIVGKVVGAAIGARLSGAPVMVTRWLGMGLIPQAGVAMGLALTLSHQPAYREISLLIVNVILATTLLYEILGPLAARFALGKAGELGVKRGRKKS